VLLSRSKDGGIDVRGALVVGDVIRTRLAVQVKRWKNNVQSPVIQQVRGSLGAHEQGLIITTSDFMRAGLVPPTKKYDSGPQCVHHNEEQLSGLIRYDCLLPLILEDLSFQFFIFSSCTVSTDTLEGSHGRFR
jgi:restriction system protein